MKREGVLVVCMGPVGDFVRCLTAVQMIAARHTGEPVDVVAPPPGVASGEFSPDIRNVYVFRRRAGRLDLGERLRLAREIRKANHAVAYVLTTSFKAALIPWLAGIPRRIGWLGELRYPLINRPRFKFNLRPQPLLVEQAGLLLGVAEIDLSTLPPPHLVVPSADIAACRAELGVLPGQRVVALVPGSEGDRRSWAATKTVELVRRCRARGWAVWLVGAGRDHETAALIHREVPGVVDLIDTPLRHAIIQLASADAFVGPDTGLTHLSAALGLPVVALYSAYSRKQFGPINKAVRFVVDETTDERRNDRRGKLTQGITVDRVFSEVAAILDGKDAGGPQPDRKLVGG